MPYAPARSSPAAKSWEHLYDFASAGTSNVVDVYVGYLRRKLDPPGGPTLIRAVRGRGYVIGGEESRDV